MPRSVRKAREAMAVVNAHHTSTLQALRAIEAILDHDLAPSLEKKTKEQLGKQLEIVDDLTDAVYNVTRELYRDDIFNKDSTQALKKVAWRTYFNKS